MVAHDIINEEKSMFLVAQLFHKSCNHGTPSIHNVCMQLVKHFTSVISTNYCIITWDGNVCITVITIGNEPKCALQ
jgi:hypothetical protein